MDGILVSIVIPIYNSEKFLVECLESLHKQTMEAIEFICVNDGSKDGSLDIINEYIKKDSRFVLLDKENSGYGISMNMGFEKARGDYIGIVESDDFVEPDMFESLYEIAKKYNLDLIKSDFIRFTTNPDGTYEDKYMRYTTNSNKVLCPADYPLILMNTTANWTGLYSKDFIKKNGIKHNETPGASYQDIGFHFLTLSLAERAYFVGKAYYHYRFDNPNSSIHNKTKVYCASDEYEYVLRYYKRHKDIGELFEGVLWARFHNTCIKTYSRLDNKYKKEYLDYYVKTFSTALKTGKLQRECFHPGRWNEMIQILLDPGKYYESSIRRAKRNEIKNKKKHVPRRYRLLWSLQDDGIRETLFKIKESFKRSIHINHWDKMDAPLMHLKIINRHVLKTLHLEFLSHQIRHTRGLKNKYDGERCFIVCTGPSLKMEDLDKISNEYTFGMNTIFLAYENTDWRPSFYVCIDPYTHRRLGYAYDIDYVNLTKGPIILNDLIKVPYKGDNLYKIPVGFDNHTKKSLENNIVRVEPDFSICAYDCFTVTNFAISAAIYMGFKTIYIIGCDFNYDGKVHFIQSKIDPKDEVKDRLKDELSLSLKGYQTMKQFAEDNGVQIFNATRGGKLEVFERIQFDSIDFK